MARGINSVLKMLIEHWNDQNIPICTKSTYDIIAIQDKKKLVLPKDFISFYSTVNGMETFYPNNMDREGFLFYPIDQLGTISSEFNDPTYNDDGIFIFAEYMHKSWWYGCRMIDKEKYEIGIIPEKNIFKPIINLLSDFLMLYLGDSPKLYDY